MKKVNITIILFLAILISSCTNYANVAKDISAEIIERHGKEITSIENVKILNLNNSGKMLELTLSNDFDTFSQTKQYDILSDIYITFCKYLKVDPIVIELDGQYQVHALTSTSEYSFYSAINDDNSITKKMDVYELHDHPVGSYDWVNHQKVRYSYTTELYAIASFVENDELINKINNLNVNVNSPSFDKKSYYFKVLITRYIEDRYDYYDKLEGRYTGDRYTNSIFNEAAAKFGVTSDFIYSFWGFDTNVTKDSEQVTTINDYVTFQSSFIPCATSPNNYEEFLNNLMSNNEENIIKNYQDSKMFNVKWDTTALFESTEEEYSTIKFLVLSGDYIGAYCYIRAVN